MARDKNIDYARPHDLTIDEVRACPEFADCTDEQAQAIIETLKVFTKVVFDYYKKTGQNAEK